MRNTICFQRVPASPQEVWKLLSLPPSEVDHTRFVELLSVSHVTCSVPALLRCSTRTCQRQMKHKVRALLDSLRDLRPRSCMPLMEPAGEAAPHVNRIPPSPPSSAADKDSCPHAYHPVVCAHTLCLCSCVVQGQMGGLAIRRLSIAGPAPCPSKSTGRPTWVSAVASEVLSRVVQLARDVRRQKYRQHLLSVLCKFPRCAG